ncbi:pyridoxal kinase [Microthyrium microscopicum]|uniref:pyridoxal kinase n=1 Tax=Microthyrium microscopicum TaxID=703497 RepID=A0A6A6UUR0_9PEZI|nr:pyridoxal kinase [Microthyrium microscopicum]
MNSIVQETLRKLIVIVNQLIRSLKVQIGLVATRRIMAEANDLIPETRVLAIASHVVYGYVGNKVATFVMQALGCDVSSINTVNYSNHTGYRQIKGTKTTADQISDLYEGLKQSSLVNFDMMLSGYIPSAEAVEAVARIGRELRLQASIKPGSFFWVLDPVLGDNGKLYVPEAETPVYRSILRDCDLVLPNQFELETLTSTTITDTSSLVSAIQLMHTKYRLPHIFVTSTKLSDATDTIAIVGSTARSDMSARVFRIDVPYFPVYFTGTGDMFAALLVARLRQAAVTAKLDGVQGWVSGDEVEAAELPLALAAEKVVASMQAVLKKTDQAYQAEKRAIESEDGRTGQTRDEEDATDAETRRHLKLTKAVELRVVRNVRDLLDPPDVDKFKAKEVYVAATAP